MNIDNIMLNAKIDALRNAYAIFLRATFKDEQKFWYSQYLLWKFERDSLKSYEISSRLPLEEKGKVANRRFQLQVLLDVACIRGQLQELGITRKVSSYAAAQAERVYSLSDHSEESMIEIIDAL